MGKQEHDDPVREAMTYATRLDEGALRAAERALALSNNKNAFVDLVETTALGIEADGLKQPALRDVRREQRRLKRLCAGYRPIDLTIPLSWRNEAGLPLLVPFSINSPEFSIVMQYDSDRSSYSALFLPKDEFPQALERHFADALCDVVCFPRREGRSTNKMSTRFNGLLPLTVRAEIVRAKEHFEHIYVLAEARDWTRDETRSGGDPLVIGYEGEISAVTRLSLSGDSATARFKKRAAGLDGGEFFLITSFDMTSIEEAAATFATFTKQ